MGSMSTWMEAWEGDLVPSPASRRSAARVGARATAGRYYGREATARLPQAPPDVQRVEPLPRPRVVVRRQARWPMIAVALLFGALLLGVSVISPMLLSSSVTETESQVGQMEARQAELAADLTALSSQVSALAAPDRVAGQAARLGLQPADSVHYVQRGAVRTEGETTVAGR